MVSFRVETQPRHSLTSDQPVSLEVAVMLIFATIFHDMITSLKLSCLPLRLVAASVVVV